MSDSRGSRLLASCWSLAATSGFLLFLRIYCKLWRGRGLWWDDHFLIIAWVTLAIAVSINTYIVTLGFGNHIDTISDENLRTISLNTILVALFGTVATTTSKTSFAITLYRIATNRWMKYFLIFVIVTINVTMNLVWIFGFAKCSPLAKVFDSKVEGTCWDREKLLKYQLFAAYYSAVLDFVLALLPWPILMGMTIRSRERLGIAIAMSLGAIAGITAIVKAVLGVSMKGLDFTYDRVDLTIWTLVEPAASIMAVSIPVLRMLYRELKSSQRSYFRNRSQTNPLGSEMGHDATVESRRTKKYPLHSKYGRNSVVIMSNTGWEDSEEALQESGSQSKLTSNAMGGVMKTEEVRVQHERLSSLSDERIELKPMSPTYQGPNRSKSGHSQGSSFT